MRLEEVLRGCVEVPPPLGKQEVLGLTCDSREVRPGWIFVAVAGEKADGHSFVARAAEQGALAVVVQEDRARSLGLRPREGAAPILGVSDSREALGRLACNWHQTPMESLQIVGVTGTKGKTTTTWLVDSIFRSAGKLSALLGTVHNRVGSRLLPSDNTTPGCLQIHAFLKELAARGGTHAALEVSSHGIQQQRIAGVTFRCGVFTNVAPEHLDYHKTFESYVETKVGFFADLPASSFAILSREDPVSRRIASRTRARVIWYGAEPQDGVEDVRMAPEGVSFLWKGRRVRARLWGHYNLLNMVGAMAAAEQLGISRESIVSGIESAVAPPGRLESVDLGQSFKVFVDYAHTDGSLDKVLEALEPVTPGRLITIFGCGGERDRTKRPRMGRVAERWSDQLVITSDNPRGEDPRGIIEEIKSGLERPDEAVFEVDRRDAIALGIRMAKAGDTVLIAGKGHETYQEIKGRKLHFDDREVARLYLQETLAS
jgi:UDP-N-acetylmuramoyl-L-alanyl-D-glutamate--2,6-diaminopimelate ligase